MYVFTKYTVRELSITEKQGLNGHKSEADANENGSILTDALSKTLIELGSAILFACNAFSRVHNGSLSHFPKTTRSMSLKIE